MSIVSFSPGTLAGTPSTPLELSLAAQVLVVVTAFAIKPACMVMNAQALWRFRVVKSAELCLARAALAVFLVGETACAMNYLLFAGESRAVQAVHDLGMAATFALLFRAAMCALESEVMHSEDPRRACALLPLCRRCVKHAATTCAVETAQRWIVPALALAALLPLTIPLRPVRYETVIFGSPAVLEHGLAEQFTEARIAPLIAFGLLVLALAPWRGLRRPDPHRLAWGVGVAGFAWLRGLIAFPFLDGIEWMGFWEEASELAMVLLVGKWMAAWSLRQDLRSTNSGHGEPGYHPGSA